MSTGRHRGRRHWGVLPHTGRSLDFLPQDIAVISLRCFATGIFAVGLAGVLAMATDREGLNLLVWAAVAAAAVLFAVGVGLSSYGSSTRRYVKTQKGDEWLRAVQEHRVERMTQREQFLMDSIAELREDFEAEKAALREIREERIAEERMVGFLRGIREAPAMRAHLANPRNRLRVVPDCDEESA